MKEYDAYLFDADGTILDTRELIYRSFAHMGRVMGAAMPDRDFVESTVGLILSTQLRMILGPGHDEDYYARATEEYRGYMNDNFRAHLATFPGAAEVLAELHGRGKKLAVVTSRRMTTLGVFLDFLDLRRYFTVLVTPESTQAHKPDPEPALLALRELGAVPERSVFVGDAIFDIKCGAAAGMDTAFVEWGGMDPSDWEVRPSFIAKVFSDLLPV